MSNSALANFFNGSSPTNWAMNQAVHLNKEGSRGAARGMMVVSGLFGPISSGQSLICAAANFPLFPLTAAASAGNYNAEKLKQKTWSKLDVVRGIAFGVGTALLAIAVYVYRCVMFLTFSPLCCLTVGLVSPEAAKKAHDWLKLTFKEAEQKKPQSNQQAVVNPEAPKAQVLPGNIENPPKDDNAQQQGEANLGNQGNDQAPKDEKNGNPPPLPGNVLLTKPKDNSNDTPPTVNQDLLAAIRAKSFKADLGKLKALEDEEDKKTKQNLSQSNTKPFRNSAMIKNAQENQPETDTVDADWEDQIPLPVQPKVPAPEQPKQEPAKPPVQPAVAQSKQSATQNRPLPTPQVQPKATNQEFVVPENSQLAQSNSVRLADLQITNAQPATPVKSEPEPKEGSPESPANGQSPTARELSRGQKKKLRAKEKKAAENGSPQQPAAPATPQTANSASQPAKPVAVEPAPVKEPAQALTVAPAAAKKGGGRRQDAKVILAPGSEQVKANLAKEKEPKVMGKGTIDMGRSKIMNRRTAIYGNDTLKAAGIETNDDQEETGDDKGY